MNEKDRVPYEMMPLHPVWCIDETALAQITGASMGLTASDMPNIESFDMDRFMPLTKAGNIAIVKIRGPLTKNLTFMSFFFGGTSVEMIRRAINAAAGDKDVETIVLDVDSPGGSVDGIAGVVDAIAAAVKSKPVIAQVDGMAASAALHAISGSTKIFAHRMDLIGAIGTKLFLIDSSKMFEQQGLKAIPIDTGEFKSTGAPGTVVTENQIADLQELVDTFQVDFDSALKKGRGLSAAGVKAVSDGRLFPAAKALELGVIDGIQNTDKSISTLRGRRRQSTNQERHRALTLAQNKLNLGL